MKPEKLFAEFDRLSEAPDAVSRLRRFVLDLAVRGKLVEQVAVDTYHGAEWDEAAVPPRDTASGNANREPARQQRLQVPFSIPAGWFVAPLGEVAECLDHLREPVNLETRTARTRGKNSADLYPYYGATQQQGWIDEFIFDEELVLLGEDGVPFFDPLRPKAYVISGRTWVNNHAHVFRGITVINRFLVHCLNTTDYAGLIAGATRTKLNQSKARTIPIPLPPIPEQHQIVATVDKLMALCNRLEAAQAERELRRSRFAATALGDLRSRSSETASRSDAMQVVVRQADVILKRPEDIADFRQTILALAVRGCLVPRAERGEIDERRQKSSPPDNGRDGAQTQDRLQMHLPKHWLWVKVRDVAEARLGKMLDRAKNSGRPYRYLRNTNVHWFDIRLDALKTVLLEDRELEEYLLCDGDVLICEGGHGIGRAAVWRSNEKDVVFQKALHRVRPGPRLSSDFFAYCIFVYFAEGVLQRYFTGVGIPHFTGRALSSLVFPLPPTSEQLQIVAKVRELMTLCDELERNLTAVQAGRMRLLEVILREVLSDEPLSAQIATAA